MSSSKSIGGGPATPERYCVWKGGSRPCGSYPAADYLGKFFATGDPKKLGKFYTEDAEPLWKLLGLKNAGELDKCLRGMEPDVLHKAFSTGNPTVLREFVRWTRAKFPAKHYLLVMWGHAFGLGFGRDNGDPLAMPELAKALETSRNAAKGERPVDILGANACAMSYAEAAYELKDAANFIVAPQIAMPFAGWPYEAILNEMNTPRSITPEKLGERIIELFMDSYKNAFAPRSVALTFLNLKKARQLQPLLKDVADALKPVIDRNGVRDQIANAFLDTEYGDVRPLIDLSDLCTRLMEINEKDAPNVKTAADKLRTFLRRRKNGLIVDYKPTELEGLHGLGVFAPSVSVAAELTRLELSKENYQALSLVKDTSWPNIVYEGLNDALEPLHQRVTEFVNDSGAVTREDRMGVAQLLLSVHRSFARFESTLTDSQKAVMGVLKGNDRAKAAAAKSKKPVQKGVAVGSGKVFGAPYLRLANGSDQQSSQWDAELRSALGVSRIIPAPDRLEKVVTPLANIEDALARVERTTKKVLTNSRLGLGAGPTKPDLGATKPDLGATKPDLGATKPDLGATKPDLGATKPDLGLLLGSMLFDNGGSMAKVTGLFREVVVSLQLVEEAVGKLEGIVHLVLTSPTNGINGSKPKDFQRRVEEQVEGAFRELTDAAVNAKLTLGAVLQHPSQGLGPTQGGLGGPERQQIAMVGGLSSRNLRLL